jgi:hypothetical protein
MAARLHFGSGIAESEINLSGSFSTGGCVSRPPVAESDFGSANDFDQADANDN